MPGYFSIPTIVLSFAIAALSGYAAFQAVEHTRYTGRPALWTFISGSMLGLGIWSMHFTGMMAWVPPYPLYYSVGDTLLSILAAVAASWLALHRTLNVQDSPAQTDLLLGGILVGSGISAMHYLGMAAVHFDPPPEWSVPGVLLSYVIAVFASMAAMAMLQSSGETPFGVGRQMVASLVIGIAICGMHYTGMLAMMLPGGSVCARKGEVLSGTVLGRTGVGASALFTLCILTVIVREKRRRPRRPNTSTRHERLDHLATPELK